MRKTTHNHINKKQIINIKKRFVTKQRAKTIKKIIIFKTKK